jgi:hypothetical protein
VNGSRLYRAALFCGAAPLLAGLSILLLWIVTRAEILAAAGLWCILLGTGSVVLGIMLLILWSQTLDSGFSYWKRQVVAILLLLINFPAAAGTIALVWLLQHPLREVVFADVTKEKTFTLSTDLKFPNALEIRAIGELDAPATLELDSATWLSLPPGPLDLRRSGDCYASSCLLHYVPQEVTRGRLRVEYRFK